jgi:hypothetical protein
MLMSRTDCTRSDSGLMCVFSLLALVQTSGVLLVVNLLMCNCYRIPMSVTVLDKIFLQLVDCSFGCTSLLHSLGKTILF